MHAYCTTKSKVLDQPSYCLCDLWTLHLSEFLLGPILLYNSSHIITQTAHKYISTINIFHHFVEFQSVTEMDLTGINTWFYTNLGISLNYVRI